MLLLRRHQEMLQKELIQIGYAMRYIRINFVRQSVLN